MPDRFEIFEDKAGEFRWRRVAGNNEVISTSEGYTRREDAVRAAHREDPEAELESP